MLGCDNIKSGSQTWHLGLLCLLPTPSLPPCVETLSLLASIGCRVKPYCTKSEVERLFLFEEAELSSFLFSHSKNIIWEGKHYKSKKGENWGKFPTTYFEYFFGRSIGFIKFSCKKKKAQIRFRLVEYLPLFNLGSFPKTKWMYQMGLTDNLNFSFCTLLSVSAHASGKVISELQILIGPIFQILFILNHEENRPPLSKLQRCSSTWHPVRGHSNIT